MATRIVFCEDERAELAGATRDERLGGTDARGGPLGNEESRGRLVADAETGATLDNMGTGGRDDLRAGGGSDLRGGGKSDDGRAGGKDGPTLSGGGHGGSFVGGARTEPRSRTCDDGGDDTVDHGAGALPFINFAVA
jgi:hypothetical protein